MNHGLLETPRPALSEGESDGSLQLVSFRLADEEYGIGIDKVREIILVGEISEVPLVPSYVKGLINLRSTVIPIVDLKLHFGLPESEQTDQTRIIVVDVGGRTTGMIVDAVNEVCHISGTDVIPAPKAIGSDLGDSYTSGLVEMDGRLLIVLDIDRMLFDDQL